MYIFEKYVLTFQMQSVVKIFSLLLLAFPVSDNNHHVELFSGFFRLFKSTHSKNFLLEPILFILETDIDIFEFLVFGYIHEGYSPRCAFISASLSAGWR
jgi:hypothetical protein